jgi:hypothetical protein
VITPYEIKTLLDALGTLGTLTVGSMPASPDVIGTIYEYGGQAIERQFGLAGIRYEKPSIQIIFRGAPEDYIGPRNKADIAWRYLPTVNPGPLGAGVTTEYLMLTPQQSPFPMEPQDSNRRFKIGFNVYVSKGLS